MVRTRYLDKFFQRWDIHDPDPSGWKAIHRHYAEAEIETVKKGSACDCGCCTMNGLIFEFGDRIPDDEKPIICK